MVRVRKVKKLTLSGFTDKRENRALILKIISAIAPEEGSEGWLECERCTNQLRHALNIQGAQRKSIGGFYRRLVREGLLERKVVPTESGKKGYIFFRPTDMGRELAATAPEIVETVTPVEQVSKPAKPAKAKKPTKAELQKAVEKIVEKPASNDGKLPRHISFEQGREILKEIVEHERKLEGLYAKLGGREAVKHFAMLVAELPK